MSLFRAVAADVAVYSILVGLAGVGVCAVLGDQDIYESTVNADYLKARYAANACEHGDHKDFPTSDGCRSWDDGTVEKLTTVMELDHPPSRLRRGVYVISHS